MSQIVSLKVTPRTGKGSRAAIKLRKQGLVPGIVYGHKEENAAVAVSAEELDRAIRVLHARDARRSKSTARRKPSSSAKCSGTRSASR